MTSLQIKIKATSLLTLLDSVKDLTPKVNWHCRPDGIRIQAQDINLSALISIRLSADHLDTYECSTERVIGVDMQDLFVLIRAMGMHEQDRAVLIKRSDEPFFRIMSERVGSDKLDEFSIPVQEVVEAKTDLPTGASKVTASLPASEFMTLCKEIVHLSPSMVISGSVREATQTQDKGTTVKQKELRFEFMSDLTQGTIVYRKSATPTASKVYRIKVTQPFSAEYRILAMSKVAKIGKMADNVRLDVMNNDVLCAEFAFKEGSLRFYTTPTTVTQIAQLPKPARSFHESYAIPRLKWNQISHQLALSQTSQRQRRRCIN